MSFLRKKTFLRENLFYSCYYLSPGLTGFVAICHSEMNIKERVLMTYLNRKSSLKSYNQGIVERIPSDVNLSGKFS